MNNSDHQEQNKNRKIGHDDWYYNQQDSTLTKGEEQTKLDSITAKLLVYFLDNPDKIISRTELIEHVWATSFVSDNAINRGVSVLRKVLGGDINRYIITIPKQGYRFVPSEQPPVDPIDQDIDNQLAPDITNTPSTSNTAKTSKNRWLVGYSLIALTLILLIGAVIYTSQKHTATVTLASIEAMNIAVLPFVDTSEAPDQQLFVDGLRIEVVNRLTRIPGLVVFGAKTNASKTRAQYILQGSVNKSGHSVRVTVQLIEASSGATLFSTIFERTLKDIFAVQQNIAQQVGAALKLSLIHKNLDYSSALAKLDHLGVERLVIARARLNTYTDTSINQAFNDLNALNQRYPKTPEVLGLLAVAYNSLSHTAQQNVPNPKQQSAKTAKESLALDPTNLDALKALYYHYTDLAHLREQGYIISEQIIRHHPGRQSAWRTRLHLMINTMRPCQEIQTFVTSIPQGVFTAHRLSIINYILNVCLQSKPLEGLTALNTSGVNQATMNKAISNNLYFFEIRHDMMFDAVQIRSRRKPTQTILTDYYWLQLASGAHSNAKATAKLIDKQGFWPWLISLYNTLYGLPEVKMNQDDAVFSTKAAQLNIMHQFAATLIIQSKQTSDNTVVTEYLSNITPFPINLFNKNEAIALMMLQYHAGQLNQSQQTAKKLFDKLAVYYKNNRLSFEFWGLGGHYLIAKFHCGEQCEFNDSLDQLFKPDYALWMDDIGFMQVALGPWASEPVVMEYLNRIEQDRVRFREKFGL